MNKQLAVYPDLIDPNFYNIIANKKEFFDNKRSSKNNYFLTNYQRIVSNFINPVSPYNSLLVYASVGIGKSLLAITIAENLKKNYKILVVLKNETLIGSFKNELKLHGVKDPKKYNFVTYNELVSQVIGYKVFNVGLSTKIEYRHKKNGGRTNLNNTVVIIDEVHNITEIKLQPILLDLLRVSYDTKLLLLTATPIGDNITEIFELNNLLNAKEPEYQLPTKQKDLIELGFIKNTSKTILTNTILNDTSNKITELGKQTLTNTLKGKISYFQIEDSADYAKKNFIGTSIGVGDNIKINKSVMSDFQESVYLKTLNSLDNTFFKNSIDASTIVFPDKTFGSKGFLKNKSNLSFMKLENIEKYSCKLYSLINAIKKSKGNVFIFTNFVNNRGIDLIQSLLQKNGYNKYNPKLTSENTFVILKGSIDNKVLQKRIEVFNSPENKNGKLIKILIGSPIISEGISLKNIRQIHVLDPPWNMSKIDQIIGRGIRYKSHQDLPISDRNVDIYLHASTTNKTTKTSSSNESSNSIDYLKYNLSYSKDLAIKEIEYLLRKISIDCILNKNMNLSKLDYSRECLYNKCNYTCQDTPKFSKKIDNSTFSLKDHAKEEYNYIYNKIIELFNIGFIYSSDYIINYIKSFNKEILNENIYLVLYEMVKNNVLFNNKKGKKCRLIIIENYILLQPIDEPEFESFYFKVNEKVNENKLIKSIPINQRSIKKTPINQTSINQRSINQRSINQTSINQRSIKHVSNIYATYFNKEFKIVVKKSTKGDKRSLTNGKSCSFYSRPELIEICKKLGIKLDSVIHKKEWYCKLLYKYMSDNKLILN